MVAALGVGLCPLNAAELSVGAGVGAAPDYVGSDEYEPVPLFDFDYTTDWVELRSNGLGVEVNVLPGALVGFGPILRYDLGRGDLGSVDDPVVARLRDVKAAPELGGFVEIGVPLGADIPANATARIEVVQGVGPGHGGLLATGSLGLALPLGDWTLGANASANFGSGDYIRAFYGVTAADAAASGLVEYRPGAGLRDVGGGVFASYALSERWSISGTLGYARIVGDAADSPIVRDRGDANQGFVGVSVGWKVF